MQSSAMKIDTATAADSDTLRNQNGQRIGAKGRRTRQKLIDVTVALLDAHGLRDLTVAEVARIAETSPATFYVYFEGVPEVVLAAVEQAQADQHELLALISDPWVGAHSRDPISTFVTRYVAVWNRHRAINRARNLAAEEGDARFLLARQTGSQPIMQALAVQIERAKAAGCIPATLNSYAIAGSVVMLVERLSAVGPNTPGTQGISLQTLTDAAAHMIALTFNATDASIR